MVFSHVSRLPGAQEWEELIPLYEVEEEGVGSLHFVDNPRSGEEEEEEVIVPCSGRNDHCAACASPYCRVQSKAIPFSSSVEKTEVGEEEAEEKALLGVEEVGEERVNCP